MEDALVDDGSVLSKEVGGETMMKRTEIKSEMLNMEGK